MMAKIIKQLVVSGVLLAMLATLGNAGVKYANEDGDYLKLGARIQLQYHMVDPDGGESTDELRFRRLRPYIEGSIHEDWKGKWQWDMGKSDIELKDAYFEYSGFELASIRIGNAYAPFSREDMTSSKKQQLVERTFVGDHNYGSPERQTGVHIAGSVGEKMLTWAITGAKAAIDPSNKKLDFDTVVSLNAGDDWIEGNMVCGRLEVFPLGFFKMAQGDFSGDGRLALAVAGFTWQNDDDKMSVDEEGLPAGDNVDDATGLELSAAVRGGGFSVDAEYNLFDAELKDGAAGVDGIYEDGETDLHNWAVEGGYMLVPERLELVAGYQSQDSDGYDKSWNRTSVGVNTFLKKHDVKLQVSYRFGENKDGEDGNDLDELFVQTQYVF